MSDIKDVEKAELKRAMSRQITNELGPITTRVATVVANDHEEHEILQEKMRIEESANDIQFKTCSWQKTAILLFAEYVCLAILSFAWSFYYVGYVGAIIINLGIGLLTFYTSHILWRFCLRYPSARDVVDIVGLLFGNSRIARELAACGLLINNILIMGLHVLTGSKILNVDSNHAMCTTGFVLIFLVVCIIASLPRTLNGVSYMAVVSAIFMGLCIFLTMVFAGIEDHPSTGPAGDWTAAAPVKSLAGAPAGVTFVQALNAVLNMTFTWAGQICYPTFIAEMKDPKEFPKALKVLFPAQLVLFVVFGAVGYHFLGQYSSAPAVMSLDPTFKKIAFTFALIPTIVIGVIYANIVIKYLFYRILGDSHHAHSNTLFSWGVWIGVVAVSWTLGMIIAEVIPSFGDLLSLISAMFGAWFGFLLWPIAYVRMNKGDLWTSTRKSAESLLNVLVLIVGIIMFGPGTYTSIMAIMADSKGANPAPFSCANNAG